MIAVITYGMGFEALWFYDDGRRAKEVSSLHETYFRLIKMTVVLEEFDMLGEPIT